MDRRQDRGAEERSGGHAEERERADRAEGTRAPVPVVEMGGRGRADRHEDTAADRLDEPRRDELVEVLGQCRPAAIRP